MLTLEHLLWTHWKADDGTCFKKKKKERKPGSNFLNLLMLPKGMGDRQCDWVV